MEIQVGGDVEGYAAAIREGIGRLKAARLNIVLMDPQFAPRVLARPLHARVVDTIAAAATDTKVAVFRRFAIMQHWISSGLADSLATAAHTFPSTEKGAAVTEAPPAAPAPRQREHSRLVPAEMMDDSAGLISQRSLVQIQPRNPDLATDGDARPAFRLLLAHNPKIAPLAEQAGFDLELSRHTHGGQFPP